MLLPSRLGGGEGGRNTITCYSCFLLKYQGSCCFSICGLSWLCSSLKFYLYYFRLEEQFAALHGNPDMWVFVSSFCYQECNLLQLILSCSLLISSKWASHNYEWINESISQSVLFSVSNSRSVNHWITQSFNIRARSVIY